MSNREIEMNALHGFEDTGELAILTPSDPAGPVDPEAPTLEHGELPIEPAVPLGEVDLDDDPFDDDLGTELERRAPRPKATRLTLALAGGLLLVIGFLGGSLAQKQWGNATPANPFANLANARGGTPTGVGASGGTGGFTGRGGSATPITGTVKLVDGTTVYIVTSDGTTVIVKTDGSTTVSQATTVGSLTAGSTVTVTGQTGTDGSVTASSIVKTK